jgi:hypothetical protein
VVRKALKSIQKQRQRIGLAAGLLIPFVDFVCDPKPRTNVGK